MTSVTESVDVDVDVGGVEQITQIDDRHNHWRTKIGGAEREFDTEIVDQRADERIAWVKADLKRFKQFIETRGRETGHWRGEVPRT